MHRSIPRTAPSGTAAPRSAALARLRNTAEKPKGAQPLTARGVAELCGVELKTVHNWVANGHIPHFRTPGRHLRFQAQDVVQFLERCGVELPVGQPPLRVLFVGSKAAARRLQQLADSARVEVATSPLEALVLLGRSSPERVLLQAGAFKQLSLEAYVRVITTALPIARIAVLGYHRSVRQTVRLDKLEANSLNRYLHS